VKHDAPARGGGAWTVFLVDDESLVIESLKGCVPWEAHGYRIIGSATNGHDALAQIAAERPDLVFADIRMPGMSGLELVQKIGQDMPQTVCVIVSGYAEFSYAQKAMSYGAAGYILKPFDETEIEALLKRLQLRLRRGEQVPHQARSRPVSRLMEEILEYVESNFTDSISVAGIAERFRLSQSHVSQLFGRELGMSYTAWVTGLRMTLACHLLTTTDKPIYEIAESCGYRDYGYFDRVFMRQMGVTPSRYRADPGSARPDAGVADD
jgi:two-component system, response regulator YesN